MDYLWSAFFLKACLSRTVSRPAVGMSAGRFTIYMSKKEMAYFKYLSKKLIISSFTESWKNSLVPWPA